MRHLTGHRRRVDRKNVPYRRVNQQPFETAVGSRRLLRVHAPVVGLTATGAPACFAGYGVPGAAGVFRMESRRAVGGTPAAGSELKKNARRPIPYPTAA